MKAITTAMARKRGSALVEATVGMVMLTVLLVGFVFFLTSTAMTAYYKYCLGFIATQSATYAASRPPATVQDDTVAFAQSMEQQMHIGTGKPTVTVTPTTVGSAVADSVTLADQFSVMGVGQGICNMQLQATGIAAFIANPTLAPTPTTNVTEVTNTYVTGLQGPAGWYSLAPTTTNVTNLEIGNTGINLSDPSAPTLLTRSGSFVIPIYDPQQLPAALKNVPLTSPPWATGPANGPETAGQG